MLKKILILLFLFHSPLFAMETSPGRHILLNQLPFDSQQERHIDIAYDPEYLGDDLNNKKIEAISPDHKRFLWKHDNTSLWVCDENNNVLQTLRPLAQEDYIFYALFSPQRKWIALCFSKRIDVYSLEKSAETFSLEVDHEPEIRLFPNEETIIINKKRESYRYNFLKRECSFLCPDSGDQFLINHNICSFGDKIVFIKDDKKIVSYNPNEVVEVDAQEETKKRQELICNEPTHNLAWVENKTAVHIYNLDTHQYKTKLPHHTQINSIAFSPLGDKIISGTDMNDHTAYLWDISGICMRKFVFKKSFPITSLSWTPHSIIAQSGAPETYRWNKSSSPIDLVLAASVQEKEELKEK